MNLLIIRYIISKWKNIYFFSFNNDTTTLSWNTFIKHCFLINIWIQVYFLDSKLSEYTTWNVILPCQYNMSHVWVTQKIKIWVMFVLTSITYCQRCCLHNHRKNFWFWNIDLIHKWFDEKIHTAEMIWHKLVFKGCRCNCKQVLENWSLLIYFW